VVGGNGDTDEFDQFVLAHEFGHYVENNFSRADSIGGDHSLGEKLDLRVAMSEGWGNAFAAMVLNDPQYRDSIFVGGGFAETDFNIESGSDSQPGWYSETSVQQVLWDLFDTVNESGDTLGLGFGPIFQALTGGQKTTDAFTSIFSFGSALRAVVDTSTGNAVGQIMALHGINSTDAFGAGEFNNGGLAGTLPIYDIATPGAFQAECSSGVAKNYNKLGNRRFVRLDVSGNHGVTISATGNATAPSLPASDPDILLWHQGSLVASAQSAASTESLPVTQLQTGTYLVEVYDFDYIDRHSTANTSQPHCMSVAITVGP